jgi:rare lipoprotein A
MTDKRKQPARSRVAVNPALIGKLGAATALALVVANCAQNPRSASNHNSREIGAFSHPKYGKASPRVVGLDESAPKGGGRFQIGRPYVVAGKRYVPREKPDGFSQTGHASWYGIAFHGRKTANGEIYDRNMISAAHPTMPLPSYARVTNTLNNHSIVVRVNDRGPYHGNRVIDLSERTAGLLGFKHIGTARVRVDYLGEASLAGSDDEKLVASLRTNGPASIPGPLRSGPTMVASAEPVASAAPRREAPAPERALGFTAQAPAPVSLPQSFSSAPAPTQGVITATRYTPAPELPVPPARPFDLETIGGAARPVAPANLSQNSQSGLPKASPIELALSDTSGLLTRFGNAASGEQHWIRTPLQPVPAGQ